ncbi:hypothetical protein C8R43DRAFT_649084 [Mycena crocata]|nr:hypothetical protein C8R43DRAFT_649084 [Mycena crocata]
MLGPRGIDSRPLQHQRSTKLLISRFESLSDHRPAAELPATSPAKSPLCPPKQQVDKKEKSPIRQSFRNLLAVLKKGSGLRVGKFKSDGLKSIRRSVSNTTLSATTAPPDDPFTVSTKSFPGPQLAGSLFYLSRSPETPPTPPSVFPVWTFCSAVLEGDTVHLTWPTTPSILSILLEGCIDVRSLTSNDLPDPERALLPGDIKDFKVFEILFKGRSENFATTSVRERARWVSAIWDVILPTTNISEQMDDTPATDIADSASVSHSRCSTIYLDRALPPVPDFLNSPIIQSTCSPSPHMPVSPGTHPPTHPESQASSIRSRSRSPSIANLSHLSVVKQRLAQIERNRPKKISTHCAPTSPSPPFPDSSVIRTRSLRVEIPPQDDDMGFISPTAILESYAETGFPVIPGVSSVANVPGEQEKTPEGDLLDRTQKRPPVQTCPSVIPDPILADIHRLISGVVERSEQNENTLKGIQNQLGKPTKHDPDFAGITLALGDIHDRLRSDLPGIMKLLTEIHTEIPTPSTKTSAEAPPNWNFDKLNQILEMLKEESLQRSTQMHQQTDSVRYLNELNSWLEAFVSGGTAQIQVVAAGVDKLCRELCFDDTSEMSVIAGLRQFIIEGQARDQTAAALHLSVNNLAALIASESQQGFTNQSIVCLIDQQRREQEALLRALTAELTNEIRGERLRFVDAMKEATAINVQMHVEELKQELAREVRADLFAFYSKQKPCPQQPPRQTHTLSAPPPTLPNPRYVVYP